jgi:hypothetical protein
MDFVLNSGNADMTMYLLANFLTRNSNNNNNNKGTFIHHSEDVGQRTDTTGIPGHLENVSKIGHRHT